MLITENLFFLLGKATCKFANLPVITSAADVEHLFPWAKSSIGSDPLAEQVATYTAEQAELRRLLDELIALNGDVALAQEFREKRLRPIFTESLAAPARHFARGELQLTDTGFVLDIPAAGTHGVRTGWLLFIDAALTPQPNGRFLRSKRLVNCGWSGCAAPYFIDAKQGGRPLLYHKREDSPDGKDHRKKHEKLDDE